MSFKLLYSSLDSVPYAVRDFYYDLTRKRLVDLSRLDDIKNQPELMTLLIRTLNLISLFNSQNQEIIVDNSLRDYRNDRNDKDYTEDIFLN